MIITTSTTLIVKKMLDEKPLDVSLQQLNDRTMEKLKSSYDKQKRWVVEIIGLLIV